MGNIKIILNGCYQENFWCLVLVYFGDYKSQDWTMARR